MWNKFLNLLGIKTAQQRQDDLEEVLRQRNDRRLQVAHDFLDGNDNWKNDYDYMETSLRKKK